MHNGSARPQARREARRGAAPKPPARQGRRRRTEARLAAQPRRALQTGATLEQARSLFGRPRPRPQLLQPSSTERCRQQNAWPGCSFTDAGRQSRRHNRSSKDLYYRAMGSRCSGARNAGACGGGHRGRFTRFPGGSPAPTWLAFSPPRSAPLRRPSLPLSRATPAQGKAYRCRAPVRPPAPGKGSADLSSFGAVSGLGQPALRLIIALRVPDVRCSRPRSESAIIR